MTLCHPHWDLSIHPPWRAPSPGLRSGSQDLAAERNQLEQQKQELEALLLTSKLQVPRGTFVPVGR